MGEMTGFKNELFRYSIVAAVIFELASLPFLGIDMQFLYGLVLGTAIGIVNFNIMEFTLRRVLMAGKGSYAFLGYLIRLMIYGGAFYISMKVSSVSGLGTLLGFLTLKAAIYYRHGFKAKFSKNRKVRPEVKAEYERMDALKEAHGTDRLRDRIRRELSFQDETDLRARRTYKRKKLREK